MIARPRQPIDAPADVTRLLVAFGLVPLLLGQVDPGLTSPPWSFALAPTWSIAQLGLIALAGAVLGVTSSRPAHGLAGVTLGILLGLAADLWWLAGQVTPDDQAFVSFLSPTVWRSSLTGSALALFGAVSAGFLVGVVVRRLRQGRSGPPLRRPTGSEAAAIGVGVISGPLLALAIASAGASSALLVPDGAQVQTIGVSAGSITVDPVILRAGPTRFRCQLATDATSAEALLLPEGVDPVTVETNPYPHCGSSQSGSLTWGTVADLHPGRYVWQQIDPTGPRTIATSPVVVVAP